MLENILVKNIALIDSLFVEFENGLNVLSGETGAGKSILIGSLTFLLGGKTSTDLIRSGTDEAAVSGSFFIGNEHSEALKWLAPETGKRMPNRDQRIGLLCQNRRNKGNRVVSITNYPFNAAVRLLCQSARAM